MKPFKLIITTLVLGVLAWSSIVKGGEIHLSAGIGYVEKVNALLKENPGLVNDKDEDGRTPLHEAVRHNQKGIVELLLANKADVNARTHKGSTPLHLAALQGTKDMVEELLANQADVNARDNDGSTPLHIAGKTLGGSRGGSIYYSKAIVELLLANKANPNIRDKHGRTPLHVSVLSSVPFERVFIDLQAPPTKYEIELHKRKVKALEKLSKEILELLLANNADVNARDEDGTTALQLAIGIQEIQNLLRKHGATEDIITAAEAGDLERVKALLKDNSDMVNKLDHTGRWTALHWSALRGHKEVVEMLLANKADVNTNTDSSSRTPLFIAAEAGHKDVVEVLLANNADANTKSKSGTTALERAMYKGHMDIVDLLRKHGATQ